MELVARSYEEARQLMESEFNSKARQNRVLGVISGYKFDRFLIDAKGDHSAALENLTSRISNTTLMIPKEYRLDAHLKRYLHQACVGHAWASNTLSRSAAEPEMSYIQMCSHMAAAVQQFKEEEAATKLAANKTAPVIPSILFHGTGLQNKRYDHGPKFYGRPPQNGSRNRRGPGPDARCRGCGSADHWLRDGKCNGKDVAMFLKNRLATESPYKIMHELCFDEALEEQVLTFLPGPGNDGISYTENDAENYHTTVGGDTYSDEQVYEQLQAKSVEGMIRSNIASIETTDCAAIPKIDPVDLEESIFRWT